MFEKQLHINSTEAIAWAALSSKTDLVAHYPGSPVNLIEKEVKKLNARFDHRIVVNDSVNEHVASLVAAGASFSGARSLLIMKHVGLNIAADPLNYIGYTGVKGGMVIIVGTDPGANSSTGEEDVHWFVPQFNFPLFEPTSVQECYDFTKEAFELSEKYEIPVMLFLPGRLAYNYANVDVCIEKTKEKEDFIFQKNREKYINVGQRAVNNHHLLLKKIEKIQLEINKNNSVYNSKADILICTRGLSSSMVHELIHKHQLQDQVELMNFNLVFPINKSNLQSVFSNKKEVIIIEDQDGFLENQLKMECFDFLPKKVFGKNIFPKYGEIKFEVIEQFFTKRFDLNSLSNGKQINTVVPERIGTFCEGCPHTGSFYSINEALSGMDAIIGGDIGCSSLAPFKADWLLCMNAGIGITQGIAAVSKQTIVSTGGDGSFFHGGALSLLNAVQNNQDLIHLVFDNETVAMTGHQDSPSSSEFDHHSFLTSIGVDKVIDVNPYFPNDFVDKLKKEIPNNGVRVFWVKGACVIKGNEYIEGRRNILYPEIDNSKCEGCSKCYTELGCPAIIDLKNGNTQHLKIDLNRCVRCGVCNEICPNDAIGIHKTKEK
jgi:indolepyruvate ferredoxin oxidoreductase alpha subunit